MLPFIEVSHLPSSSSFYSSVTQPLGLQYVSTLSDSHSITYGVATLPPSPVFELHPVRPTSDRALKLSHVVFSASSPSTVARFQAAVQRAHEAEGRSLLATDVAEDWRFPIKAVERDLDGNTMEVVYVPPQQYPESHSGSTVRRTNSSTGEISRIMTWNYDVATSEMPPYGSLNPLAPVPISTPLVSPRHPGHYQEDGMAPIIRRSVTTTSTTVYEPVGGSPLSLSPRQNSSGLSTSALVGTLLGAAAAGAAIGAGIAYGTMRNERGRSEFEPPSFQRRSTAPLPVHSQYLDYDRDPLPPATLLTEGSGAHKPLMLTDIEHRSYMSSRHSARTSEMEGLVAAEQRSAAGLRQTADRSRAPSHAPSQYSQRSNRHDEAADRDRESYVSTRSHGSVSTVRRLQPTVQTELTGMEAPRRSQSYVSAREAPVGGSRATSHVSARKLGLPASRAGSSRSSYREKKEKEREEEDDVCSIAPSDSISCVGSRKGSRVYA